MKKCSAVENEEPRLKVCTQVGPVILQLPKFLLSLTTIGTINFIGEGAKQHSNSNKN